MFSNLFFIVDGQEITFNAYEIIKISQKIVQDSLKTVNRLGKILPDHKAVDEELDKKFWSFTKSISSALERSYQVRDGEILRFINYAFRVCREAPQLIFSIVTNPQNNALLKHIKGQHKERCMDVQIDEHIMIPMQLIFMNTIEQWLFIAKHLAENHLNEEHLSGWWFRIGGRVVRLRNDVENGEVSEGSKQFYAADHGFEMEILKSAPQAIHRCLKSFTWNHKGSFFRAFKFWQYYTLFDYQRAKEDYIEKLTDDVVRSDEACQRIFQSLGDGFSEPPPLAMPTELSEQEILMRERVFNESVVMYERIEMIPPLDNSLKEWVRVKFIIEFESGMKDSKEDFVKLFEKCMHCYFHPDVVVPYDELTSIAIRTRSKKYNQVLRVNLRRHQSALKEEFISRLNDTIAESNEECQLLLCSLAHDSESRRGISKESKWREQDTWQLGTRKLITNPEVTTATLSGDVRARYEAIFDDLIENFRYVTEANIMKQVQLMRQALSVFQTQIKQIMHEDLAEKYISTHILYELAKDINHGKQEPIFREVTAYGDRESGNSYHLFEESISNYLKKPGALSDSSIAMLMRSVLSGKLIETEDLGFLPCLTAAWFISETARNPMTTLTSLMLLDMIESNIYLETGSSSNWYSWSNSLIHPQKAKGDGKVTDLYNKQINIDEFGGCHPMVHQGSVHETNIPLEKCELYLLCREPNEEERLGTAIGKRVLIIKDDEEYYLGFRSYNGDYQEEKVEDNALIKKLAKKPFENRKYEEQDLNNEISKMLKYFNSLAHMNAVALSALRQKEGHLLIHWLQLNINAVEAEEKNKLGLQKVEGHNRSCDVARELDLEAMEKLAANKIRNEKKLKRTLATIRTLNSQGKDTKEYEEQSASLEKDIAENSAEIESLEKKLVIKQKIQKELIEPLLKKRLSHLGNMLQPSSVAANDHSFDDVALLGAQSTSSGYMATSNASNNKSSNISHRLMLAKAKQESLKMAQEKGIIGPRTILNWTLQDVDDKGNCFYAAVADQLMITQHNYLKRILVGTAPNDSLRLLVQGDEFKDQEWADDRQIEGLVTKMDIVIAVIDTRFPAGGYSYRYKCIDGDISITLDRNDLPTDKKMIKLAATGNHFLSVRAEGPILTTDNYSPRNLTFSDNTRSDEIEANEIVGLSAPVLVTDETDKPIKKTSTLI